MSNISAFIPKESKIVQAIYGHYKKQGDTGHMSRTLAVSLLGRPCERYLWYCFRQCCKPKFDGRMYRLFDRGNLEEARLTADLRAIGCTVHTIDESTGKQFLVLGFGGHLKGYMDGCALGIPGAPKTWHVLEYKTHKAKYFKILVKKGVKEAEPEHYAQMQIYMRRTGMRRALYLAVNKDTDEIYAERIHYDKAEASRLMLLAERIIEATTPPDRISERPDFYLCNWCDARAVCWGSNHKKDILGVVPDSPALPVPALSCRQCCHATPIIKCEWGDGGWWKCEKDGGEARRIDNCKCDRHLILPGLLPFAEPEVYNNDERGEWIEFRNTDGTTWRHGNAPGSYSSKELTTIPANVLGSKTMQITKDLFGATITGHEMDILQRYPEGDSRIIWKGPADQLVGKWREAYNEDLTHLMPVGQNVNPDSRVVELSDGRIAILWIKTNQSEIREGVE